MASSEPAGGKATRSAITDATGTATTGAPSNAAPSSAAGEDWLGYGDYADAAWHRIQRQFEQIAKAQPGNAARRLPTDDPLVVGVYGEWGAGKTRLLQLVHERVHQAAIEQLALRALDPQAYAKGKQPLRITLPVWFHAWKYEHEPALAVPLLMHLGDALQSYLKDGQTHLEVGERAVELATEKGVALAKTAEKYGGMITKGASWIHAVAAHKVTQIVVGAAAGFVDMKEEAQEGLQRVKDNAATVAGIDPDDDTKAAPDAPAQKSTPKAAKDAHASVPRFTTDGSHYYNIHRHLRELSHITPASAKALNDKAELNHDVHLNFVVFIDDLDRCLPEKAVEVMEVIKTLLNVDSFAFVVALDDEVIERGISHRYRDYRFKGAKPEMPITGFEYLEKIVHLPFRLPQLTRAQAARFVRSLEDRLVEGDEQALPRLWFTAQGRADAEPNAAGTETREYQPTPLLSLLLDSFEAHVPRKLARTVEALHHQQRVLHQRGVNLGFYSSWGNKAPREPDARVLLACTLLQLFAPEHYRLLKRRPLIWREWMWAYLTPSTNTPSTTAASITQRAAFEWVAPTSDLPQELHISDALLFRWVVLGEATAQTTSTAGGTASVRGAPAWGGDLAAWRNGLAAATDLDAQGRFTAEQVRLPWVLALCEYRDAHRHAFDPLRMGAALAHAAGWHAEDVPLLTRHLQLFGGVESASVAPVPAQPALAGVVSGAAGFGSVGTRSKPTPPSAPTRPTGSRRAININLMLDVLASQDAGTRRALVERLGLQTADNLPATTWPVLKGALKAASNASGTIEPEYVFDALGLLAPYLARDDAEQIKGLHDWTSLPRWLALTNWLAQPLAAYNEVMGMSALELARSLEPLARHDWVDALGLADISLQVQAALVNSLPNSALPIQKRAQAADALGPLGDQIRFDFKAPLYLPTKRRWPGAAAAAAAGAGAESELTEPIPGFVRIPGIQGFQRGQKSDSDNLPTVVDVPTFYMARTLTTVDQWAAFLADQNGSETPKWWGAQGWAWRQGIMDDAVTDENYKGRLARRPAAQRHEPADWANQIAFGNRPVVGISWFEARAYAQWLHAQLKDPMSKVPALQGHQVRLPTEDQWERAARASSATQTHQHRWPWGDVEADGAGNANILNTRLSNTSAVGLFPANPLGLHDLAGNAWEWQDNLYTPKAPEKQRHSRVKPGRVLVVEKKQDECDRPALRGGSWFSTTDDARCAYRNRNLPDYYNDLVGLRVVLSLVDLES